MMAMEDRSDTKIAVWCEHGDRVPEPLQGKTVAALDTRDTCLQWLLRLLGLMRGRPRAGTGSEINAMRPISSNNQLEGGSAAPNGNIGDAEDGRDGSAQTLVRGIAALRLKVRAERDPVGSR
jgi:hypothetical protein